MKSLFTSKTLIIVLLALSLIASSGIVMNWSRVAPVVSSWITSSPQPTQPTVTNPPYRPSLTIVYLVDTPPNYPIETAIQADKAVADAVDSLVTANQGGVHLIAGYIDSTSFEHYALTIKVPAVSATPVPPVCPTFSDPYKQAQAKKVCKKQFPIWQKAYDAWQKNFASVKAHVHQETQGLRNLKPRFDNTGSSTWGGLFSAARDFQGVSGNKILLIASALIQNRDDPIPSGFTLSSVRVSVIFHNCITSASACAANEAKWRQIFKRYGARSVSFSSVQDSQVQHLSL